MKSSCALKAEGELQEQTEMCLFASLFPLPPGLGKGITGITRITALKEIKTRPRLTLESQPRVEDGPPGNT